MRTLRHHLLLEEDRNKLSQGKERNSNHFKLHLGEERFSNNKKNWQKRNNKGDLRDKLDKKHKWNDHGRNNYSSQKNDSYKKNFPCHNYGHLGHFRAT